MKQKIPKEDGNLKRFANWAHFSIADRVNGRLSINGHKTLAATEGLVSGYAVAFGGESVVNLYNPESLENLAYIGLGMVLGVGVATRIAPRHYRQFLQENPVYGPGIAGVMTGASLRALDAIDIVEKIYSLF